MTDLPPLPPHVGEEYHGPSQSPVKLYDGYQLRAYALTERAAERKRCLAICKAFLTRKDEAGIPYEQIYRLIEENFR